MNTMQHVFLMAGRSALGLQAEPSYLLSYHYDWNRRAVATFVLFICSGQLTPTLDTEASARVHSELEKYH